MRIGIIGDVHLNEWKDFSRLIDNKYNSRLLEQKNVLDKIIEIFNIEKVDKIVVLGDVFHRFSVQSCSIFNSFLELIKDKGIFILGNHDFVDEINRISYLDYFDIKVVNKCLEVDNLVFLSYFRDTELFINFLNKIENKKDKILFCHLDINGVEIKQDIKEEKGLSMDLLKDFKKVFNGHYHRRKKYENNIYNVGSIMEFSFADMDDIQKGVNIYDTEKDVVKFFPLEYKKFIKIENKEELKLYKDKYYVRVVLKDLKDLKDLKTDEVQVQFDLFNLDNRIKVKQKLLTFEDLLRKYSNNNKEYESFIFSVLKNL